MRKLVGGARLVVVLVLALACLVPMRPAAQTGLEPAHGKVIRRFVIRNAMVIYGTGNPPYGPVDIMVEDGLIARIQRTTGFSLPRDGTPVIDATGKYVMPGIINTHMHWHEERMPGIPQPIQYERNLYLAAGVTTVREVGGNFERVKQWRADSAAHTISSPRILIYTRPQLGVNRTPDEIRAGVREAKQNGADGLKIGGLDRDQLEALMDEAHRLQMRTATHIGVEETTAKDYIELGVTSIEHFYGIADAALEGVQNFPADMNYDNEIHRFARAGELFAQAKPEKLLEVVDLMVEKGVAWTPTLSIYEASRDIIRSQNLPWYGEYLHPSMEEFFKPNLENHGSYFVGWTNTQEVRWKKNYRVWMDALKHFGSKGGLITTGDDAGYIYSLYGFGLIRELELQEEAGFHPLEVIRHATADGAKLLGLDHRTGRVRQGYLADLLVVNGNPLDNLRILTPGGTDVNIGNRNVRGGGIEWTIKDGIPYHVPVLLKEVRDMVARARTERGRQTTAGP